MNLLIVHDYPSRKTGEKIKYQPLQADFQKNLNGHYSSVFRPHFEGYAVEDTVADTIPGDQTSRLIPDPKIRKDLIRDGDPIVLLNKTNVKRLYGLDSRTAATLITNWEQLRDQKNSIVGYPSLAEEVNDIPTGKESLASGREESNRLILLHGDLSDFEMNYDPLEKN